MSMMQRGLLGLVAWLVAGFIFTEGVVLTMNVWVLHETQRHEQISSAYNQSPSTTLNRD